MSAAEVRQFKTWQYSLSLWLIAVVLKLFLLFTPFGGGKMLLTSSSYHMKSIQSPFFVLTIVVRSVGANQFINPNEI